MKTLQQAIERLDGRAGAGATLRKHLTNVGISSWDDFTRDALYELRDHLCSTLAPTSAKTVCATVKALLNRYADQIELPGDWQKILAVRGGKPSKTYLTEGDLEKFADAPTHTKKQELVKNLFLICAYTGLRVSDAMALTTENIVGGNLHYVAQKTKKAGAIPLKKGLAERIAWLTENKGRGVTLPGYNKAVRDMARRAGIDDEVVVLKAGKELRGPKWKYISSHTARISTATCLSKRGVPINDISALLQHSGTAMTERYIVRDRIELSPEAMQFFK